MASIALHGLSPQREAAGAAGKIDCVENKFRAGRIAQQVEILLTESGVVNFFDVTNDGSVPAHPVWPKN